MTFLGPIILRALLNYLADPDRSLWAGALLATALLGTATVQTLAINAYFHILFRVGMHVKTSIVAKLFEKALRVSAASRAELGVGAITNLMSSDASKVS